MGYGPDWSYYRYIILRDKNAEKDRKYDMRRMYALRRGGLQTLPKSIRKTLE